MNIMVAVDQNWGIGKDNQLLARIPEDLKRLKEMTLSKVVVMGRATLESLPGGRPLPGRSNVVLTRNPDFAAPGVEICRSLPELFETISRWDSRDVFVLGGDSVYRQLLDCCEWAYLTRIQAAFDADAYFPSLDALENWEAEEASEIRHYGELAFCYQTYRNRGLKSAAVAGQ